MSTLRRLQGIHQKIKNCRACSKMCSDPVPTPAVDSPVILVGQAPGSHEGAHGKPFANTAGKVLFKWLGKATYLNEEELRERIYIAALARCFPGKAVSGSGDRPPSPEEIENCRPFLKAEILALEPQLILAVGRLSISEILGPEIFPKKARLEDVVGKEFNIIFHGHRTRVLPLPHPSGVSRWTQTEPGKTKLKQALKLMARELPALLDFEV